MNAYNFNPSYSYKKLPSIFYHDQTPLAFDQASYVLFNHDLARALKLNIDALKSEAGIKFILGHHETLTPLSMAYAGHQYGNFTLLGDGRAHLIMEHTINDKRYDIHLKGSGPTVYSRGFDGRATLRSALLEYMISTALDALNVPTTKALAVIQTGDKINRIGLKHAAILVRVAQSHLRVGTFEYAVYKGSDTYLKPLVDYAIKRHDDDLLSQSNLYIKWYKRVIKRQAKLIALWQSIGFVHGVMNTDNMTISGETIDFGPCAFIDQYDLKSVYSSIDTFGRYAYGNQPYIASWNLAKLGQMILPLVSEDKSDAIKKVQDALETFSSHFENTYYEIMGKKLGFHLKNKEDVALIDTLLSIMEKHQADYTETFVGLSYQEDTLALFKQDDFIKWKATWLARIKEEKLAYETMKKTNPVIIPRNHIVKKLLDQVSETLDFTSLKEYLHYLKNPYDITVPIDYRTKSPSNETFITYCGT
ncbi:MAG: protein adenylyltransferase SelO [Candidatus Izemoplasmataceae bacterium]